MNQRRHDLRIWSRGQSYGVVTGVIAGMLFAGLAVPLVFGNDLPGTDSLETGGATALPPVPSAAPTQPGALPAVTAGATGPTAVPVAPGTGTSGGNPVAGGSTGTTGATGSTSSTGSAGGGAGTGGTTAKPTASDRGVTATTIKLGVVLLDLSAVTPLGMGLDNYEVSTQRQAFQAFIDEANRSGGLYGRKIVPFFDTIDPLDSNGPRSAQAICVRMVKDEKVFAVTGFAGAAGSCAAVQYQTPTVINGADVREVFEKSRNYYITAFPSMQRIAQDWAGWLDSTGLVRGKKLGIFSASASPEVEAADALDGTLKSLGYKVTYRTKLQDQSQMAIEVNKMKSAGVDTVLLPTNFLLALQFVQSADDQRWKPQYLASDIGNLSTDGLVQKMSAGFNNAISLTSARESAPTFGAEPAMDTRCRTLYNARTSGRDFSRGQQNPVGPACLMIQVFAKAAQTAGVTLTRAGIVAAVQQMGSLELPVFGQGTFRAGKTDFADTVRPLRWAYSCRCYAATGAPVPVRY